MRITCETKPNKLVAVVSDNWIFFEKDGGVYYQVLLSSEMPVAKPSVHKSLENVITGWCKDATRIYEGDSVTLNF